MKTPFNPFSPSEIITNPGDFYGRKEEMESLVDTFRKSSNVIEGIIGIGKSSLSYQTLLRMEGLESQNQSKSISITCHRGISSLDELARSLVRQLVEVDELNNKVTAKFSLIPKFSFGGESGTIIRNFVDGHHLEIFRRLVSQDYISNFVSNDRLLIIWIDEADKIPQLVAQFVRVILNQTQSDGVPNVRFLVSGVQPFFTEMLKEDSGLGRFFPSALRLRTMLPEEAEQLIAANLVKFVNEMESDGRAVSVHPAIIGRIRDLSNGNPSIAQLLGYKVIEAELEENDGSIDERDLVSALRSICLADRDIIYSSNLNFISENDLEREFGLLFREMVRSFPGQTTKERARQLIGNEALGAFLDGKLIYEDEGYLLFMDELFRVRIILDGTEPFLAEEQYREEWLRVTNSDYDDPDYDEDFTYVDDSNFFDEIESDIEEED